MMMSEMRMEQETSKMMRDDSERKERQFQMQMERARADREEDRREARREREEAREDARVEREASERRFIAMMNMMNPRNEK